MKPLRVDDAIIVCEKPAGLLAVPGKGVAGSDNLWARLQRQWPDAEVVHRLDMATSGLMVFARGKPAQRQLGIAFAQRRVNKRYVAVVDGAVIVQDNGWREIDLPLAADWPNRPRQKVDSEAGKPSLTRLRVLAEDADSTRLELMPFTGRSHQLRVHLMAIGHPILGDMLYASPEVQARAGRLLLHASGLAFDHPESGEPMAFDSPAPF